ncbi:HAD family hydrolase [Frateuria defendens]|uniref:HAD family hydrolase n=1 Tax=Frateuria defendens TaxID=2219559 RepID=UPI00066FD473|nr:HAD family hydrolase [Frateuria defendens]
MNLALFDFDGTITTRAMFADFLHAAVPPRRRLPARIVLAPLVAGYKLGLVPGNLIRASAVRVGLAGLPEAVAVEHGRRFASAVLPGVLREIALERIAWHRAQGDRVMVVSGALDVYLSPWCRQHGLELICSELEVEGGVLTGRYRGAQCVGPEKARRVAEACDLSAYPEVYAYGDTREDFDLLRLAHHRYFRWQAWPGPAAEPAAERAG